MGGWWCKDLLGKEKQYTSHVDCGKVGQVGGVVTWGWEQEGLGSGACERVCACARERGGRTVYFNEHKN